MIEYRNSTIEELYGPSRISEPSMIGQINWTQIGIQAAIITVVVVVPVICVYCICNEKQKALLNSLEKKHEENIALIKKENQELLEAILMDQIEKGMVSDNIDKNI